MSNNKKIEQYGQLALLRGRLQELEETYHLIGTTAYYRNRQRVLKNQIENIVRSILGISSAKTQPKKVFVFEVEAPEQQRATKSAIHNLQASVEKSLVTEYEDNELTRIADLFGIDVPNDLKDRNQYLLTEIQGFFEI